MGDKNVENDMLEVAVSMADWRQRTRNDTLHPFLFKNHFNENHSENYSSIRKIQLAVHLFPDLYGNAFQYS